MDRQTDGIAVASTALAMRALWHAVKMQSVRALFIDFTKAFDHIDHVVVLEKLAGLGVPEFFAVGALHSCLIDNRELKRGKAFLDWLKLNGGMPQGSWLSPYIFLTLIINLTSLWTTLQTSV